MGREYVEVIMWEKLASHNSWLCVTFLVGLFGIMLFRRDAIAVPGLFKMAWFWFAASIALPAIGTSVILRLREESGFGRGDANFVFHLLAQCAGPLCMAAAMFCLVQSMLPRKSGSAESNEPDRCPLD